MKARVIATGETFDVYGVLNKTCDGYAIREVELLVDDKDSFQYDMTPAYWEKLKHQYAGMAMQGLCANAKFMQDHEGDFQCHEEMFAEYAKDIAHALVEKYKKEESK